MGATLAALRQKYHCALDYRRQPLTSHLSELAPLLFSPNRCHTSSLGSARGLPHNPRCTSDVSGRVCMNYIQLSHAGVAETRHLIRGWLQMTFPGVHEGRRCVPSRSRRRRQPAVASRRPRECRRQCIAGGHMAPTGAPRCRWHLGSAAGWWWCDTCLVMWCSDRRCRSLLASVKEPGDVNASCASSPSARADA